MSVSLFALIAAVHFGLRVSWEPITKKAIAKLTAASSDGPAPMTASTSILQSPSTTISIEQPNLNEGRVGSGREHSQHAADAEGGCRGHG